MAGNAQRRGRPRDSRVDHAVSAAVRELLDELGYAGLTVDAVAGRAGVGKAGIYRRFGSKAEMVFAAVVHDLDIEPPPDTGSLRGDLHALLRLIHARSGSPVARQVIPALLADGAGNPALVTRFQQTFLAAEHADFTEICDRAQRRGELVGPVDPELAHLLLAGPHFAAVHAYHVPVDDTLLGTIACAVGHALIALAEQAPTTVEPTSNVAGPCGPAEAGPPTR